jgi:UbiD family decarboxylase
MKDLRTFISACEKKLPKEFIRISREVDPKYEISAIVKKLDLMGKHPLFVFEKVKEPKLGVTHITPGRDRHRGRDSSEYLRRRRTLG